MSMLITRTAPSPLAQIGRIFGQLKAHLARRRIERRDRMAFARMLTLDDSMLRDIGVHRGDVEWAARLPLSQNGGAALHRIARENRLHP